MDDFWIFSFIFLFPQVKGGILKGKLTSPVNKDKVQQLISVVDIGEIDAEVFLDKDKFLGKTITIA